MPKKKHKYCVICHAIDNNVPSFGFPKEPDIQKKWIEYCRQCERLFDKDKPYGKLCSKHFQPEDIIERKSTSESTSPIFRLRTKEVVPSVFIKTFVARKNKTKYTHTCFLCDETNEDISYFKFPKDMERRRAWLQFCEYPPDDAENLGEGVKLCEKHFREEDIVRRRIIGKCDVLLENAQPKIFTPDVGRGTTLTVLPELTIVDTSYSETQTDLGKDSLVIEEVVETTMDLSCSSLQEIIHNNCSECSHFLQHITDSSKDDTSNIPSRKRRVTFVGDIKSPDLCSPERAKRSFQLAKDEVLRQRSVINKLQKRIARLKANVKKYSDLVEELKKG